MDRIIEHKSKIRPNHYKFIIVSGLLVAILAFFVFRNPVKSVKIDKENLNITEVYEGEFSDYISITGQVAPISTVYLDAIEGGRIEEIFIEEGTMVKKGDIILAISNNNLNLSILNSEAQLAEKSNFLREVQIKMEQQKLEIDRNLLNIEYDLKSKKRNYLQNKSLFEEGLIAEEEYLIAKEEYELAEASFQLFRKRKAQDSLFRKVQTEQLGLNLGNMQKNLQLVSKRLDNLLVKAPVDGQLGMLNAEIGQAVAVGQRLGQINVLTSYKLVAEINEHYVDRVQTGQIAYFSKESQKYNLMIKKVYPEVRDHHFNVDLVFQDSVPKNIRTGQSYYLTLEVGLPKITNMISKGSFFQHTGGQWIFVLNPAEEYATKRNIVIGKQNPKYYEIIEGLNPGEKVIISNYDLFGDNDKIIIKQ